LRAFSYSSSSKSVSKESLSLEFLAFFSVLIASFAGDCEGEGDQFCPRISGWVEI